MELATQSARQQEKLVSRVSWAIHILSCLSGKRTHVELDATEEEEPGDTCSDLDAETERTIVLQGPSDSIRYKFLDCIAQLLSQSKGWDNVVATALCEYEDTVVIHVARNDCFGIPSSSSLADACTFGNTGAEYCRELVNYLSATQRGKTNALTVSI